MKKKLLLYLSKSNNPANIPIASTLAWLCKKKNCLFDNYYDSYHQGIHFPGGDSRNLEEGELTGGTVSGDRHFEEFYFILLNFDVSIIIFKDTIFLSPIKNFDIPLIALSDQINIIYNEAFRYFNLPFPSSIVMIGSHFKRALSGMEAYLYPEIFYREAIGVPDSIAEDELANLYQEEGKILCLYVDEDTINRLEKKGYTVEIIDTIRKDDDYCTLIKRTALRWKRIAKGWMLGDPTLVSHWLPTACEEDFLSIYSVPQEKIVAQFGDLISSKGKVIYGRQYSDKDFFELSKLNQCLQVIDPYRPPFQSVKHVEYTWNINQDSEGFYGSVYSDEDLRAFAREGKILISLMFWSGMIREIANLYNLIDLFTITRLRCGLVLTTQSYEYMMHSPLELLTVPLEQGGVYPLVEPVLGSCGIGVGVESYMTEDRLLENLKEGLARILKAIKKENYMPKGWWATMDTNLESLSWYKKPKPIKFLRYSPYVQFRFHAKDKQYDEQASSVNGGLLNNIKQRFIETIKTGSKKYELSEFFVAYRPYEFYEAGPIISDTSKTIKSVGLKYMFTKAGFNSCPEVKYLDNDFIALNYTSGQWDGWTPFETINDISDLRKSEKILLKKNKPGWIVSTIDSCLWTFSGEFWKRGSKLYEIAKFCAEGGNSGRLINVKPFTISRYARILSEID
ncbi:MAG: hypothetical protein SWO11_04105 [Thermodesulfobacteriota bacterium]|nr:hypothetical protein [Thermodesulfobacteriota bacterium]